MNASPCNPRAGVAAASGNPSPSGCLVHDGLLWMDPGAHLKSWHGAHALTRCRMGDMDSWRLPTASELVSLFRSGQPLRRGWPMHFFWSLTTGANGAHYVVHHADAEVYVHDNDRDFFCCALVRANRQSRREVLITERAVF
jgi:hypothetical protein